MASSETTDESEDIDSMVAWVSTYRGRRYMAAIGARIAALGALTSAAGLFVVGELLMWAGVAVLALGLVIVAWSFFHETRSGFPRS